MLTVKGTVSKIKVLKLSVSPLVRFNVDNVNCLIATNSLNFLAYVNDDTKIVISGTYNSRKQFVVKRYCVLNKKAVST